VKVDEVRVIAAEKKDSWAFPSIVVGRGIADDGETHRATARPSLSMNS